MSTDEYVPSETDWTYDAEAGAAYLRLRHGRVRSSEAAGELFVVDFGQDDETLGIEVLSSADAALIDAWLARVRRDAARAERQRIADMIQSGADINHEGGYVREGDVLDATIADINRLPETED